MKIVLVGPGALGSLLAAFLNKTKEDLWLLGNNKEQAACINSGGIKVEGVAGSWSAKVRCSCDAKTIGQADIIILTVKSYHTKEAVAAIQPLLNDRTQIISLQNGVGNLEIISESWGQERVIGGVTNLGATLLEPGRVRLAGMGETVFGRLDGKIPVEMRYLREAFTKAGLEVKFSKDIKAVIWSKLVINVGINALSALARLPNGKLIEFEGTHSILREAVTEAVRVAKRKKIKLIYDDPLAKAEAVCEATADNISSMLQDILHKRRTEIDVINGTIVRLAQELGIPVPVNSLLLKLIKTIESGYDFAVK